MPRATRGYDSRSATWHRWVDVSGKILGAAALAVVTFLGYQYQSRTSMTALINQREQSETQLRASMLHDLIEPVLRREPDNQQRSSDEVLRSAQRDRLLAELVTLNFHDHFELKPLLESVDENLRAVGDREGRERLASVARRVIDRQLNMLTSLGPAAPRNEFQALSRRFSFTDEASGEPIESPRCLFRTASGTNDIGAIQAKRLCSSSPDRKYCLEVRLYHIDYERNELWAAIDAYDTGGTGCDEANEATRSDQFPVISLSDVKISRFDFPLTDNTEIDRDHRFSLALAHLTGPTQAEPEQAKVVSTLVVWFPPGFVTERERPINYQHLRQSVGLD